MSAAPRRISARGAQLASSAVPGSIHLDNLTKRYGAFTAVDGLSLDVAVGETYALLGPNGAGKTTTVEILEGLLRPTAGRDRKSVV